MTSIHLTGRIWDSVRRALSPFQPSLSRKTVSLPRSCSHFRSLLRLQSTLLNILLVLYLFSSLLVSSLPIPFVVDEVVCSNLSCSYNIAD